MVKSGNMARQIQPQSGSTNAVVHSGARPAKAVKDRGYLSDLNAHATINHLNASGVSTITDPDRNAAALGRIFGGVIN